MAAKLEVRELMNPNGKLEKTLFIPAFLEDNPLGVERDPEYEHRLMMRDDQTAKALRFGQWSVFAGQMFPEFGKSVHTCDPFAIPPTWTRWVAMDWGYAAPWCALWFARDITNGRLYVYRELYFAGLTDPQQAEKIKEVSSGETSYKNFADPSMWTKRTTEVTAKSTYDVYLAHGVLLSKANNDNQNKISKTHSALSNMYDGKPYVQIFSTCYNLIRTIPTLMRDIKNVEALMPNQEDHAWDAFAYGLTDWVPPVVTFTGNNRRQPAKNPWNQLRSI